MILLSRALISSRNTTDIGVSKRAFLPGLLLALGVAITPVRAETQSLPDLGNAARNGYSEQQEGQLGREVMVQIRQSRAFISDPELSSYIQDLGERLAGHVKRGHYQFFLINDPSLNAFALPGGYIGINSGLLSAAGSESELAAVLAHEIIHVDQQHFSRMMAARRDRSGLTLAALLASMVLAGSGNQAGEAGIAITAAANMAHELSYSRNYEREADRLGIQLLANSGYHTGAMADFFERLQKNHRLMGASGPEYLRTHPIETNRIAEARNRAAQLSRKKPARGDAFFYAKARLVSLYEQNSALAEKQLQEIGRVSAPARDYGLAILYRRINRNPQALEIAKKLRTKHPSSPRFLALEADIQLHTGNKSKGLSLYRNALDRASDKKTMMLRYATALLNYRQFEDAYKLLGKSRVFPPQYPEIEKLYAQAAGESGRLLEAHRAMAEYYYMQGNTPAALQQLRIASNHAKGDQYQLAGIEARKIEMERNQ